MMQTIPVSFTDDNYFVFEPVDIGSLGEFVDYEVDDTTGLETAVIADFGHIEAITVDGTTPDITSEVMSYVDEAVTPGGRLAAAAALPAKLAGLGVPAAQLDELATVFGQALEATREAAVSAAVTAINAAAATMNVLDASEWLDEAHIRLDEVDNGLGGIADHPRVQAAIASAKATVVGPDNNRVAKAVIRDAHEALQGLDAHSQFAALSGLDFGPVAGHPKVTSWREQRLASAMTQMVSFELKHTAAAEYVHEAAEQAAECERTVFFERVVAAPTHDLLPQQMKREDRAKRYPDIAKQVGRENWQGRQATLAQYPELARVLGEKPVKASQNRKGSAKGRKGRNTRRRK